MKQQKFAVAVMLASASMLGCDNGANRTPDFEPNFLYAHALEKSEDVDLAQPLMDSSELVEEWFGTLNDPKIPPLFSEEYADLLSIEKLKMAAGDPPSSAEPGTTGLYRQQCASCHGESGQGRGPVAASQNPYPREFRHGWFKYKSPNRQGKPLKEDLKRILVQGLADSQMPKFTKLSEQQIDSLVDYVIYLSIRGELERKLLYLAAYDLDLGTARIYNASWKSSDDEKEKSTYQEQVDAAKEILTEIADAWNDAEDRVEDFAKPSFPIFGQETNENKSHLAESIEQGRKLFVGDTAACAKCHGLTGKGDGTQASDYDDWTKDWTSKIGIQPTDAEKLLPLMARGGLKPQPLKPRNIVAGHLRGGREPIDIYRRIRYGIPGATMPAAAMAVSEGAPGLTPDDVWHLVNYVLSIAEVPTQIPLIVDK